MKQLVSESAIQTRVRELGAELSELYRGRPLTVIGVLTGCMLFLADLVRAIDVPHRIGVVHASSYRGEATTPGQLHIDTNLLPDIRGRDLLIVDDIFDTGRTIERLLTTLQRFEPHSIRTAVLLVKEGRSQVDIEPDFHCFQIPDCFVIGYGLDFNDDYRHLPFIGVLDEPVV